MSPESVENSCAMAQILRQHSFIPVVNLRRIEDAVPLAKALAKGGLGLLEVTLRSPCALDAIQRIKREVPELMVGAGTIITVKQMEQVAAAGGAFGVSPGLQGELLLKARNLALPYLPGVVSASEIMTGLSYGYSTFKFFPAEAAGGVEALRAFLGPFPKVNFCPSGGIKFTQMQDYFSLPNTVAIGASWLAPQDKIEAGNWSSLQELAAAARSSR